MPIILTFDWDSEAVSSIGQKMPVDRARKWEIQAGHMFFKHRRAIYHLTCIKKCYREMIEATQGICAGQVVEDSTHTSYSGPLLEIMLFHLDSFFEAERSGYDFVLPCLRTAGFFQNIPSSFNDYYKEITKNPSAYPCESSVLSLKLMEFWGKTGQRTRNYRDCLSHYISLSGPTWQHAMNMKWVNEGWMATFHLPDNPEKKSYSALTFNSSLDALNVCTQLNEETDHFLKTITSICRNKWNTKADAIQNAPFTLHNIKLGD